MDTGMRMKRLSTYLITAALLLLSCAAQAGPITVTLTGVLGADSPFGDAGSEYSFSFDVDDIADPSSVNGAGNSATFDNAVTAVSFLTMTTSIEGAPTNDTPDANLLIVSDGIGQGVSEDVIQAFIDLPDQDGFSELSFGFVLLDQHADGQQEPDSVTSLGLDVFSLLDISDFTRDPDGEEIANNQLVFSGVINGVSFSDFSSTITSIAVTPRLVQAPAPGPGAPGPVQAPVQAPEPEMIGLLLFGGLLIAGLHRSRRSRRSRLIASA